MGVKTVAPTKTSVIFNPQDEIAKQATVHTNLKQDVFFTTKDKLLLMLRSFQDAIEFKQQVVAYGSISITLLVALVTSEPKNIFGLSADVWKAIFIVALIACIILTINSIYNVQKTKMDRDINNICRKIMSGDDTYSSESSSISTDTGRKG